MYELLMNFFDFISYFVKSKYYAYSNVLTVGRMDCKMGGVAVD